VDLAGLYSELNSHRTRPWWHVPCNSVIRKTDRAGCAERQTGMLIFALGMMVGTALGIIVVGFLAVRSYGRGYDEALERRKAWRGELVARQQVVVRSQRASLKRAS